MIHSITAVSCYLLKEIEERRIKTAKIHQKQTSGEASSDTIERAVIESFRISVESLTLANVLLTIVEDPKMEEDKLQLEAIIRSLEEEIAGRLL